MTDGFPGPVIGPATAGVGTVDLGSTGAVAAAAGAVVGPTASASSMATAITEDAPLTSFDKGLESFTWLTDPHLEFCSHRIRHDLYQSINQAAGEIVVITGDISAGPHRSDQYTELAEHVTKPIYFVLGKRSEKVLGELEDWMSQHNAVIMTVLCLVIAAKLIGDAIGSLAG